MRFLRFILATLLVMLWITGINWLWSSSANSSLAQNQNTGGFAASQERLLLIKKRESDLEFQAQVIREQRLLLDKLVDKVELTLLKLDPKSEKSHELLAQIDRLKALNKALELTLIRINSQLEALEPELEAVNKVIQQNINTSGFSANSSRLLLLQERKSELELEAQEMNQSKLEIDNQIDQLVLRLFKLDLDPESEKSRELRKQIDRLKTEDKVLEIQLNTISSQSEAIKSVMKVIQKNFNSPSKILS